MAIEAKWERVDRPSLEYIGRMVLVANWRTVEPEEVPSNEDDAVFYELYFDYSTGCHFRQREGWASERQRWTFEWVRMDGHKLVAVAPNWAKIG